jgi:dolichol-phosphate mannosyltransferase
MIPTYNESENIVKLIDEITSLSVPELHIVVVDDNSPDGTAEAVKKKDGDCQQYPSAGSHEEQGAGKGRSGRIQILCQGRR